MPPVSAVADIVVVMAQVPKSEGRKGGITAFVLEYDADGVTVEHRNQFMGLRGIENSVTRLENVFVPEENVIGKEGMGLKIALTTLNTGRLALPAICLGVSKWSTKVAREWGAERVQWGKPVGKHDAVAQKIAQKSPLTLKLLKRGLRDGLEMSLPSALAHEQAMIGLVLDSADAHEGCRAFLEKRAPNFTGR